MAFIIKGLSISEELWAGFMHIHSLTVSYGKGSVTSGSEMIKIYYCPLVPTRGKCIIMWQRPRGSGPIQAFLWVPSYSPWRGSGGMISEILANLNLLEFSDLLSGFHGQGLVDLESRVISCDSGENLTSFVGCYCLYVLV